MSESPNEQPPSPAGGHRPLLIELTQAVLAIGFTAASIYLTVAGRGVPGELWTLTVGIVSYYFGKRAPFNGKT